MTSTFTVFSFCLSTYSLTHHFETSACLRLGSSRTNRKSCNRHFRIPPRVLYYTNTRHPLQMRRHVQKPCAFRSGLQHPSGTDGRQRLKILLIICIALLRISLDGRRTRFCCTCLCHYSPLCPSVRYFIKSLAVIPIRVNRFDIFLCGKYGIKEAPKKQNTPSVD